MNVAELFVEYVARCGGETCYSVNGGMAMYINKALAEHKKIRSIFVHHEQAAVCAAEGYAKSRDFRIPGLVCVTAGPGVSNALTGILSANADSAPIFVLAGQVKESDIDRWGTRTHGVQEIRSIQIMKEATKGVFRISKHNIESNLLEIHSLYQIGRPGVIFIEIPLDVQQTEVREAENILTKTLSSKKSTSRIENEVLKSLIQLVSQSQKTSFFIGNGTRISGVKIHDLLNVLRNKCIPRFYTWLSQDLESFYDPSNLNCPGSLAGIYSNKFLQESDLVFFLGARLDLATTAFQRKTFGAKGKRIIIDIDPRELAKFESNPDDILIQADICEILEQLIALMETYANKQQRWEENFKIEKEQYLKAEEQILKVEQFSTRDLTHKICEALTDGTLVMSSSGYAAEGIARFFRGNGNLRFFHGGGLGSMGQGLSHGIGAVSARISEEYPVWILESDGGLMMNLHELATLKYLNPKNAIVFILNNGGYASIKNSQIRHFGKTAGTDSSNGLFFPSWESIAGAFNIPYLKYENPEIIDFKTLIGRDLTIVEIHLDAMEMRGPALKTVMTPTGPQTQRLEQIDWN
jgi:acetolactate synthase-1/2/3 large subunit